MTGAGHVPPGDELLALRAELIRSEAFMMDEIAEECDKAGDRLTAIKLRGCASRLRVTAEGMRAM